MHKKGATKYKNDKPDKEDKETEAAEDGGERNQNQVTKVLCGRREEKHLKSIISIGYDAKYRIGIHFLDTGH